MPTDYLIHFAQTHAEFRVPELVSISELCGFEITFPDDPDLKDSNRPFMVINLECEEHARQLARRCILIKHVYKFWGRGNSYDELHASNKARQSAWERYKEATSFRFIVDAFQHSIPGQRQREVVESFRYMAFTGPVVLSDKADITLGVWEEYTAEHAQVLRARTEGDGNFKHVWFGKLVEEGSARPLVNIFEIKKRAYYGNTTMDAEISLLMANQAQAAPGKLVYDPFVGTGSMLYTAAQFGALVIGSDMDGRQIRGKDGAVPGIRRSAEQYGITKLLVDCCTFDITRNPWRTGDLFDAIVTDPPYGVRAGAKRQGRKEGRKLLDEPVILLNGREAHLLKTYVPPTRPYEMDELAQDLVELSRYLLKPGGRLVFFLPTVTDDYQDVDIPKCEGMELRANSLQEFGRWGRRLITMIKTTSKSFPPPTFGRHSNEGQESELKAEDGGRAPSHKDFRQKYFGGFKVEGQQER